MEKLFLNLKMITGTVIALSCVSCGDNYFKDLEAENPAVDAVRAMETQKPDRAETILLGALGDTFKGIYDSTTLSNVSTKQNEMATEINRLITSEEVTDAANLVSLLASARASIHSIDELKIAIQLAKDESGATEESGEVETSEDDAEQNQLTTLFPALPEATTTNIEGAEISVALLRAIGSYATEVDEYKLALFQTASLSLSTKTLDVDGDGSISTVESINITDATAASILSQLLAASSSANGSETATEGSASAAAAANIGQIYTDIQASEGSTDAEKLSNFLSNNSANTTTALE